MKDHKLAIAWDRYNLLNINNEHLIIYRLKRCLRVAQLYFKGGK